MNSAETKVCAVCVMMGVVMPWLLLIMGAVMSLLSSSDYWGATAAYISAAGLIWLGVTYLFAHAVNTLISRD